MQWLQKGFAMLSHLLQGLQKIISGVAEPFQRDTAQKSGAIHSVFGGVWRVFLYDEHIANMKYLYDDQPCHIFEIIQPVLDNIKVNNALNTSRAKNDSVALYNIEKKLMIKDENFYAHYDDSGKVGLRIFGPICDMTEDEICETKTKL